MNSSIKGTILYVGNFNLPDKGAAANRVTANGKIFNKLGYRTVFLGVSKDVTDKEIHLLDQEKHMYEEAYPSGIKEWLVHMISVDNIESLVEKYEDVKMIVLYNLPYTLLLNAKRVFSKKGIKVVYDCTEWTGVTDGSLPKRIVKKIDEIFIRNMIGKTADGLVVISRMMENQYKNCKNLIKLPPLVDINDDKWHQKIEKKEDVFEFCFAGILDGDKDSLDIIVDAFNRLKEGPVRLRIIGVTEEEFCHFYNIESQFVESGDNEIIFMGTQAHKETIKYVQNCNCYIFIRKSDRRNNAGFPTKFAESYTCGMPIIASDISDIREHLENGYLVEHLSVEEVLETMKKAMAESSAKESHGLNRKFHYEEYKDPVNQWLENILK